MFRNLECERCHVDRVQRKQQARVSVDEEECQHGLRIRVMPFGMIIKRNVTQQERNNRDEYVIRNTGTTPRQRRQRG